MEYNDEIQQEIKGECPIADTELCYWTGKNGCIPCYVKGLKDTDDKLRALENWKVVLSNLPRDIDSLHESNKCVLCKGDIHGTECYASVDMAHPEPKSMKGMFFGMGKKIRTPVGSLVTVNMASCNKCRKELRLLDAWTWIFLFGMIALAFVLASVPSIMNPLNNVNPFLPIAFVIVLAVLGYFLGKSVANLYRKKICNDVKIDITEVPLIRNMMDKGWFFFQDTKGQPKLFFKSQKTFGRLFCENESDKDQGANI